MFCIHFCTYVNIIIIIFEYLSVIRIYINKRNQSTVLYKYVNYLNFTFHNKNKNIQISTKFKTTIFTTCIL